MILLLGSPFKLSKTFYGICTKVVDGDTVIVHGERIRLANIDAPESEQTSLDGIRIGKLSYKFLQKLVEGKELKIQYQGRGYYGRIIGTLSLGNVNINEKMVESGMAISLGHQYMTAQYEAKIKRRGIFSTLGFLSPKKHRKLKRKKDATIK
ncbi:MAG: hypothetical protein HON90_03895 [Halobacteriovoraceae bacterium]|nr:hypothetical protein [Halobacteriovoraceae bacterium]